MKKFTQKIRKVAFFGAFALMFVGIKPAEVPFTVQAPLGNWSDPLFQDACEEASVIMAMAWAKAHKITAAEVTEDIKRIAEYERREFGTDVNTGVEDTARIIREYYDYNGAVVKKNAQVSDIIQELQSDKIIIAPVNGRVLGNPHYTGSGPVVHMLVLTGYDSDSREFVANDPGTSFGGGYRYGEALLFNAIRDYPTGDYHSYSEQVPAKNVIVVAKEQ